MKIARTAAALQSWALHTHEIGLRIALGDGPRQMLRLALQEGKLLGFIGPGWAWQALTLWVA